MISPTRRGFLEPVNYVATRETRAVIAWSGNCCCPTLRLCTEMLLVGGGGGGWFACRCLGAQTRFCPKEIDPRLSCSFIVSRPGLRVTGHPLAEGLQILQEYPGTSIDIYEPDRTSAPPPPRPPVSSLSNSPERRGYSFILLSSKFIIQIRELARTRSAVSPRYPKFIDTIAVTIWEYARTAGFRPRCAVTPQSPGGSFYSAGVKLFFANEADFDRRSTDSRPVGPARERGHVGKASSATFRGALRY